MNNYYLYDRNVQIRGPDCITSTDNLSTWFTHCLSSFIIDHDTKEVVLTKRNLYKLFEYVQQNKSIFKCIFSDSTSICEILRCDILEVLKYHHIKRNDVSYQLNFFFGGLHQIIQLWLNENCSTSIDSIVNTVYQMMPVTKAVEFLVWCF